MQMVNGITIKLIFKWSIYSKEQLNLNIRDSEFTLYPGDVVYQPSENHHRE